MNAEMLAAAVVASDSGKVPCVEGGVGTTEVVGEVEMLRLVDLPGRCWSSRVFGVWVVIRPVGLPGEPQAQRNPEAVAFSLSTNPINGVLDGQNQAKGKIQMSTFRSSLLLWV